MKTIIHRSLSVLLAVVFISSLTVIGFAAPAKPMSYISRMTIEAKKLSTGEILHQDVRTYSAGSSPNQYIEYVVPAKAWQEEETIRFSIRVDFNYSTANECTIWLGSRQTYPWREIVSGYPTSFTHSFNSNDLGKRAASISGEFLTRDRYYDASPKRSAEIVFVKEQLQPAPTGISYNNLTHTLSGLNSNLSFRYNGDDWYYMNGTSYNMYEHLSTSRTTKIEVKNRIQASEFWTYTVPALPAAPTGLYIDWLSDRPVLLGLDESLYYTLSDTPGFYNTVDFSGYGGIYLDSILPINPGDSIYIRSAANSNSTSISSAYATVTAPPKVAAPATDYDTSTHSILGLMSNMDFRIGFPDGWSDWIQSPADNVYFNAYPYLSTSYGTQAQVRYRNSPDVVQTHNISALRPAPTGLSFEWLNGVGLVLWGFEAGHYYNFMTDPYFDDWYVYDADMYGINLSGFGLMPGDALYVREAANSSSETSACAEVIVPPMPPATNAAALATAGTTASSDNSARTRSAKNPAIASFDKDLTAPDGQQVTIDNPGDLTLNKDNSASGRAPKKMVANLGDVVIGTAEKLQTVDYSEPILYIGEALTE